MLKHAGVGWGQCLDRTGTVFSVCCDGVGNAGMRLGQRSVPAYGGNGVGMC